MTTEELIAPALEAYAAALREHGHNYTAQIANLDVDVPAACLCGWAPTRPGRSPRRAVGLHIAAAARRASRAFDATAAQLIANR